MIKNKKSVLYIFCLLCLVGAFGCGWMLYQEWVPRKQADNLYEEIRQVAFPGRSLSGDGSAASDEDTIRTEVSHRNVRNGSPDFADLTAMNPDIIGWLWSPGTDIDYPVMQGPDNDYYLNRTVDKKISVIGSVFMESGNRPDFEDDVTVLYGHHIKNGRMFSSLSGYKSQSYYESHRQLYLYTPDGNYKVTLFAGQILNGKTGTFPLVFGSSISQMMWIDSVLAMSTFQSEVRPVSGDRILTLCTCTYEYDDARYAVYGVLEPWEGGGDE